jgi:hypothetical protein
MGRQVHPSKTCKKFDHDHAPNSVGTLRHQHNKAERMYVQFVRKWAAKNPSFKPGKLRIETTTLMRTEEALQEDSVYEAFLALNSVAKIQGMLNETADEADHIRIKVVPVKVEKWLAHLEHAVLASRVTGDVNRAPSYGQLKRWAVTVSMLGLQSRELARLATKAARDPNTTPLVMAPSFIHNPRHPTSKWHLLMLADITVTTRLGITKFYCRDIKSGRSSRPIGGHLTQKELFDKTFDKYPTTWGTKIALDQTKRCACHGHRLVRANRKLCKFSN